MRDVVCPVTAEVKDDITGKESPPTEFHPPGHEVVDHNEQPKHRGLEGHTNGDIADAYENGSNRFLFVIYVMATLMAGDEVFDQHEEEHGRGGPDQEIGKRMS